MSEQNKALVRRWLEGHERGMPALDLLAPDFVDHAVPPGLPPGPEGTKASFGMVHKAFSDWRVTVDDMVAEGDKVATRGTIRFKHAGEFQGIRATGKQVTIPFMQFFRIRNGKLAEYWREEDTLGLLQQLGVVKPPGAGS